MFKGNFAYKCNSLIYEYIFLFSGESLVYGFDDLTGSLQLSHKLVLSSKDYPGILVKYCQHF